MSQGSLCVKSSRCNEVARAAGVPADAVRALVGRGELSFIPGTRFISVANPARTARRLRDIALDAALAAGKRRCSSGRRLRRATGASRCSCRSPHTPPWRSCLVVLSMDRIETAPVDDAIHEESHLVFLVSPGPGGGGGGGGLRQPRPAPKIARRGASRLQVSVPRDQREACHDDRPRGRAKAHAGANPSFSRRHRNLHPNRRPRRSSSRRLKRSPRTIAIAKARSSMRSKGARQQWARRQRRRRLRPGDGQRRRPRIRDRRRRRRRHLAADRTGPAAASSRPGCCAR